MQNLVCTSEIPLGNDQKPITDFTFYMPKDELDDKLKSISQLEAAAPVQVGGWLIPRARVLICSCFRGQMWSITVRYKEGECVKAPAVKDAKPANAAQLVKNLDSVYQPSNSYLDGEALFSVSDICSSLADLLDFVPSVKPSGLLLVTGQTASLKSEVARGLIHLCLSRCYPSKPGKGVPHLVTYEDPIEVWYWKKLKRGRKRDTTRLNVAAAVSSGRPLNYTPREAQTSEKAAAKDRVEPGKDVRSVKDATRAALRQTPAILYVGEIRDDKDFKPVLDFAGTGHLVVATAHAGCLTEAMGRLLRAYRDRGFLTAGDRSVIADRVLGIVHNRKWRSESGNGSAIVPSLWRRQGQGKQAFVSDGLGAIIPGNPEGKDYGDCSSFGRYWFVKTLVQELGERTGLKGDAKTAARKRTNAKPEMEKWALTGDLQGK